MLEAAFSKTLAMNMYSNYRREENNSNNNNSNNNNNKNNA